MRPLSERGQNFTARVEDKGVRIYFEEGNPIRINWCFWLGAINLLCKKALEENPCVRVGSKRGSARMDTIEGMAQYTCDSQFSTATWIAKILVQLDLARICKFRPLSIELNENGKNTLYPIIDNLDNFSTNLAEVLKGIEKIE